MKKTIFSVIFALAFGTVIGSCGQATPTTAETDSTSVDSVITDTVDTVAVDTASADSI